MAAPHAPRTRVIETLERQGIPYRLLPHGREVFTVEEAAAQRDVLMEEMVKSILLRDKKRRYAMACVRGDMRVDPKAVRAVLPDGYQRLQFASAEEIREITGCIQGAVAPVGLPEQVPVVCDEIIARCERVNLSSGDPAMGLEMKGSDLLAVSRATVAAIAEPREG